MFGKAGRLCRQHRPVEPRRHQRLQAQRRGGRRLQRPLRRLGGRRQRRRLRRPDRRRPRRRPERQQFRRELRGVRAGAGHRGDPRRHRGVADARRRRFQRHADRPRRRRPADRQRRRRHADGGEGNDVLRGGADSRRDAGEAPATTSTMSTTAKIWPWNSPTRATTRSSTTVSFALGQHVENLIAYSDAGLMLRGNGLANIILGAGGNDTLIGGDGDDPLRGDAGVDAMQRRRRPRHLLCRPQRRHGDGARERRHRHGAHDLSFTLGRHVENLFADFGRRPDPARQQPGQRHHRRLRRRHDHRRLRR